MDNDNWNGQVRVNKDILKYKETLVMGLNIKQLISAGVTVIITLGIYFLCNKTLGNGLSIVIGAAVAFPAAAFGFVTYNGMSFAQLIKAIFVHIKTPDVLQYK